MRLRRSEQEDYLLRIIRQIGEMVARVRELLTGTATSSDTLRAEVDQSIGLLLGDDAPILGRLDAESAVRLVNSRRRIELWATLLELDADICDRGAEASSASLLRARAAALREAAGRLTDPDS